MAASDDDRDGVNAQENRIDDLKRQAREAAGGTMTAWESDALPADQSEAFWRRVVDFETAPLMSDAQRLQDGGIDLPDPDAMDDAALSSKLWHVIRALARMRVFITATDHLSDRELYDRLWRHTLREENPIVPDDPGSWHVDLVGSGSEEDTYAYLKYYADEDTRQQWRADFPDYEMPAQTEAPFRRDCLLPQSDDESSADDEDGRPM